MEQVKGIINRMLNDMPKGLTDLEKARYIYIALGKEKSYDEEFWFANSKMRQKIFKSKHSIQICFDKLIQNKKVLCTSISKIYSVILKQIGIENYIERDDLSDEHMYVILNIEGKKILADLQRDLSNIQSNKKTAYFGTKAYESIYGDDFDEINKNELEEIDKKIGYISVRKGYLNDDIFYLKSLVKKQKDLYSKVDIILKKAGECSESENIGYIESVQYYKWILSECLDEKELRNVINTNCYRENNNEKQYVSCLSVNGKNGYKRYIYSSKEKRYIGISDEKINQFMCEGLKIVPKNSFPKLKKINREER